MSLISRCVCGAHGPFLRFEVSGVRCERCECGVAHQVIEISREEYEAQYASGEYHAAGRRGAELHAAGMPVAYRERYAHDYAIAQLRFMRYGEVLGFQKRSVISALDVGCANGAFVDYLRDRGVYSQGIEPAKTMARQSIRTGTLRGLNGSIGQFDLVTYHDVLEHLVDPAEELAAAAGAVHKGGSLIVDVPDVSTPAGAHHYKLEHVWYLTADAIANMMHNAGLKSWHADYPIPGKVVVYGRRA